MSDPLANLDPRSAFAALKKLCGGAPAIAKALGISIGWVYRWGGGGRDSPIMSIPAEHWSALSKMSGGIITEKSIKRLHERKAKVIEKKRAA